MIKIKVSTLIINAITAIMMAVVLELVLAFGLRHPRFIPDPLVNTYRNLYLEDRNIIQVSGCAEYDPDFFYRFKKGKCSFTNREFDVTNEINSLGLRDDEASLNEPSIVIFGDSFTMGWGVPQEKCYPHVLEGLCQQKVLNAGISSFGTAREMKLLHKLDFEHVNTVIIQYHSNDYPENVTSIDHNFNLPIRPRESYEELRKSISDRNQYTPFKYLKRMSKSLAFSMLSEKKRPNDTLEAHAFLQVLANSDLPKIVDNILVFRIDDSTSDNGFVDALDHLLRDEQFAKLNITTMRIGGVMNKNDYFILDEHLNERGHEKLAIKLKETLGLNSTPIMVNNAHTVQANTMSLKGK